MAALALVGCCLVQARFGYSFSVRSVHARGVDDAYISFRYARNLAEGAGLVWNPPGADPDPQGGRVEGYSNPLYVLALGAALRAGAPDPYPVAVGLNTLCALGTLLVLRRFLRRRLGEPAAILGGYLFALCPPIYCWVASGLETVPVLLLQVLCWTAAEDVLAAGTGTGALAIGTGLLSLLRADGCVWPALCCAVLALRGRWRAALPAAAVLLATALGATLLRLEYYGFPLPNTYYAKVSGPLPVRLVYGLRQLRYTLTAVGLLPHVAALLLLWWRRRRQRVGPMLCAGWGLYWIYVGGDAFLDRFLLPLFPLGLTAALDLLSGPRRFHQLLPVGGACLVFLLGQVASPLSRGRAIYSSRRYDAWITLGQFLGRAAPGRTLAACAAGKLPYYSGLRSIDILGLNDLVLGHRPAAFFQPGHNKFDADYVLGRHPDLIATWIDQHLELRYGFTRDKIGAAGYRMRYLLNTGISSLGRDVLDVSGADDTELSRLISQGYTYAVLARTPPGSSAPSP